VLDRASEHSRSVDSTVRFGRRARNHGPLLDQIVAAPWYMKVQGFGPFMMGHAMTARDLFSVGAAGAYAKDDLRRVAGVGRPSLPAGNFPESTWRWPSWWKSARSKRETGKRAARKSGYYRTTNRSKPKAVTKCKYMKAS
jgi:hypothetical protein